MADDNSQDFKIHIITDADNSGFKSTSEAAQDLSREMGVINVSQEDVEKATKKTTEAFTENRHELKKAGDELGNAAGVGRLGSLMLGGVAAAAFGAARAVEFLKSTWEEIRNTINGPIEIGLPEKAAEHISAAATAWNQYAAARAKVITASQGADASASAEEKKLANELKLIKEVLAAEKEKALADLELNKGAMTPDAYNAARANISNIFGEAGTAAEQKNQRELIANKSNQAFNLEIEARQKTQQALGIKAAPAEVAEANQKALDENAAKAAKAKSEIEERIALIDRFQKYKAGGDVLEYEGADGKLQMLSESYTFAQRYGYWMDPDKAANDARSIETPRLAQADAAMTTAERYRKRQETASAERARLMNEAGAASGKAAVLRGEVETDTTIESHQKSADAEVARLHQSSAGKMAGVSQQTVTAVQNFTAATVGGFADVHTKFIANQFELNELRRKIAALSFTGR